MESEEAPDGSIQIELTDESMKQELIVELTRGQILLINEFLANNIQPKGYEMIAFAYDLFNRLQTALNTPEDPFPHSGETTDTDVE